MLFFDIESDGFLDVMSVIHCIHIFDGEKHYRFDPANDSILAGVQMLQEADAICGHNIVDFDIPGIRKIFPHFEPKGKIVDTLVLSYLAWPDIKFSDFGRVQKGTLPGKLIGRYSLESFGYRLGELKGTFGQTTDWKRWTPEMSDYCEKDVKVTFRLYNAIKSRPIAPLSASIEHKVREIISRQSRHGFWFDINGAKELYAQLLSRREALRIEMQKEFPPFYQPKGKLFTPKRDNARLGYTEGATLQKLELVEFNPASQRHIYAMLMRKYGWKPKTFVDSSFVPAYLQPLFKKLNIYTDIDETGHPIWSRVREPKVDETVLSELEYPEAKLLVEFLMLNKRCAQIADGKQGWLKKYRPSTHAIHGAIITNGAVTGRMRHHSPNIGQVPAVGIAYGAECRALFGVRPGYKLVGCDAAGIEARCLAHYLWRYDAGAYVQTILEGKKEDGTDVHSLNAKRLGISRTLAKRWFYAYMYGAGDSLLGEILGGDSATGKRARARFNKNFPALATLIDDLKKVLSERGYIKGLDGRKLMSRSEHSILNLLLQHAGAMIMKQALIYCEADLQAAGFKHSDQSDNHDYEFVANVHDEFQIECKPEIADEVGEIARVAIVKAGEFFKWRCPQDGEYKIGNNWAETH